MRGWPGTRLRASRVWSTGLIDRWRVHIRCRRWWRRLCWSCGGRGRIGVRGGWCTSWQGGVWSRCRRRRLPIGRCCGPGWSSPRPGTSLAEVEALGAVAAAGAVADGHGGWVPALAEGCNAKALTGIDDHSRVCVSARLMLAERTRAVCDGLAGALRAWGGPV